MSSCSFHLKRRRELISFTWKIQKWSYDTSGRPKQSDQNQQIICKNNNWNKKQNTRARTYPHIMLSSFLNPYYQTSSVDESLTIKFYARITSLVKKNYTNRYIFNWQQFDLHPHGDKMNDNHILSFNAKIIPTRNHHHHKSTRITNTTHICATAAQHAPRHLRSA